MINMFVLHLRNFIRILFVIICLSATPWLWSQTTEPAVKPGDPFFAGFHPLKAPAIKGLILRRGDRLAICGDSITEQRMYSRIIETYLTVCVPQLRISVRQYGWGGETAEGFLRRMTNDCLRFHPTIATTCYGMNDFHYKPYDAANLRWYDSNQTAIVEAFKSIGARVVLGSPTCVGKMPPWVKSHDFTARDLNLNLCALRNSDIEIAKRENVRFADEFWPMFNAGFVARAEYGSGYAIAGSDGVHPHWAGHLIIACSFLKALGLDGRIGTFGVNLQTGNATATPGHTVDSFTDGVLKITSRRYPFCASGSTNSDNSIRSGMTLVPFNEELNRLMLVVKGAAAENYAVTWGDETRVYSAAQLANGVNLAADFPVNPFSGPFSRVDTAVAAKQAYETRQIKDLFHGPEGRTDMKKTAALTEEVRTQLAEAVHKAFVPVTYTIQIKPQ